jgi:hypothetical protein
MQLIGCDMAVSGSQLANLNAACLDYPGTRSHGRYLTDIVGQVMRVKMGNFPQMPLFSITSPAWAALVARLTSNGDLADLNARRVLRWSGSGCGFGHEAPHS